MTSQRCRSARGFGLGLHLVLEDIPGMRHAGTGDWAGLFNCYYWIDRPHRRRRSVPDPGAWPFFDPPVVENRPSGSRGAVYAEVGAPAAA